MWEFKDVGFKLQWDNVEANIFSADPSESHKSIGPARHNTECCTDGTASEEIQRCALASRRLHAAVE